MDTINVDDEETCEQVYAKEVSNLVCTLIDAWGYDRKELDTFPLPNFNLSLDVDVTSRTGYSLVCRGVRMYPQDSHGKNVMFLPPVPGESGKRVPTSGRPPCGVCDLDIDLAGIPLQPSKGDYVIPEFSELIGSDPDYQGLEMYEQTHNSGRDRTLHVADDHPIYTRKSSLHMDLLTEWISLLNVAERVRFGLYVKPTESRLITASQASKRLRNAFENVYAFTTTPGPHCIFTLGLCTDRDTLATKIDALEVATSGSTINELVDRGYHFFILQRFRNWEDGRESLMQLRRTALKLLK